MPLTGPERAKIRFYLGYSAMATHVDPDLIDIENAMDTIDLQPDDLVLIQAPTTGILARLDSAEAALLDARKRIKASKVGSIELNSSEICQLRSEQDRARLDLAGILGVENLKSKAGTRRGGNYVGI